MITYLPPLNRAWKRMRWILFSPFDAGKWLALGFTAWLASLADHGSGGGSAGSRVSRDMDDWDWEEVTTEGVDRVREFLESGLELAIVLFLVLMGLLIALLVIWVSSRGSFMFLDNVVHNRSRIRDPWSRYSRLGDSLFLWRIMFVLATILIVGSLVLTGVFMALPLFGEGVIQGIGIVGLVSVVFLGMVLGFVAAFISLLVDHFIVPLMYKHDLTVLAAWRKFLPLLKQDLPSFFLYGCFYLVLYIGVAVVVFVLALATCCVGLLVISIPYLGTLLLLPLYVTARGLGLEFLAQFGPEYSVPDMFPEKSSPDKTPGEPAS